MITQLFEYGLKYYQTNKRLVVLFMLVGALTAGVNFFIFTLLWKYLNIDYKYAVSIAYLCATVFHFYANRHVTFKSNESRVIHQWLKYIVMNLINYFITLSVVEISVDGLQLSPFIGLIAATACTAISGYLLSKLWVFKSFKLENLEV